MRAMSNRLTVLLVFLLTGCAAGGAFSRSDAPGGGPHPHVSAVGALHVGPGECLHTPVSNARPVTDLTVCTLNIPIVAFGPVCVSAGAGWQFSRSWGSCDSDGFNCAKNWTNGWTAAAGVTYCDGPFCADLRGFSFNNSPVGTSDLLPGLEMVALMFRYAP